MSTKGKVPTGTWVLPELPIVRLLWVGMHETLNPSGKTGRIRCKTLGLYCAL